MEGCLGRPLVRGFCLDQGPPGGLISRKKVPKWELCGEGAQDETSGCSGVRGGLWEEGLAAAGLKGPAEACVRKGAPTRLPGRPRGWAAGGARLGGREGARGRAGAGGQASRSGLRTAGGAWNLTDPARPGHPTTLPPGEGAPGACALQGPQATGGGSPGDLWGGSWANQASLQSPVERQPCAGREAGEHPTHLADTLKALQAQNTAV